MRSYNVKLAISQIKRTEYSKQKQDLLIQKKIQQSVVPQKILKMKSLHRNRKSSVTSVASRIKPEENEKLHLRMKNDYIEGKK